VKRPLAASLIEDGADHRLLMVGAGKTGRAYLKAARRRGVGCLLLETAQHRHTEYGHLLARAQVPGSLDEQWLFAGLEIAAAHAPTGVLPFGERHVLAAELIAERFHLRGASLGAAIISRNKALQRSVCDAAGVPQPRWTVAESAGQARSWLENDLDGRTAVVKPLSGFASIGVSAIRDPSQIEDVVGSQPVPFLVEEFIPGDDYSWEAFVLDGAVLLSSVTADNMSANGEFVETGHFCGSDVAERVQERAGVLGRAVVRALGVRTAMVHVEFKLADSGPIALIEVAVRAPGGRHMALFKAATGVDPFELRVRLALGLPVDELLLRREAPLSAATVIFVAEPGVVTNITGVQEASALPGVQDVDISVKSGDRVGELRSGLDWAGLATVVAASPERRDELVRQVKDVVHIHVDSRPDGTRPGR
jgi:biotin carboxylase